MFVLFVGAPSSLRIAVAQRFAPAPRSGEYSGRSGNLLTTVLAERVNFIRDGILLDRWSLGNRCGGCGAVSGAGESASYVCANDRHD